MLCTQCPRSCGALRTDTRGDGLCRMPALPVLARAALHHWEEPPISGTRGSGTIFFSGCSLGCLFCQNEKISHQDFGKPVTMARLRDICQELADQGAHNLNFVNPTHYAHTLRELLENWRPPIPVVWNSGGYDRVDTLRSLEGLVDIYLPDLKYLDAALALRYSNAWDYPQIAVKAIEEMYRQVGDYEMTQEGCLSKGLLIRHLVLPNHLENTKMVVDWCDVFARDKDVLFSLMGQYTPVGDLSNFPEIARPLLQDEYQRAAEYLAKKENIEGYLQEVSSSGEEYIPSFCLEGLDGI